MMTRTLKAIPTLLAVLVLATPALAKPKASGGKTQVEIQVKPATAQLFIDNKPQGKVGTNRIIELTPGAHLVKVTNKGDEHEEKVKFSPGQKTIYSFEFDEAPAAAPEAVPDPVSPDAEDKHPDPLKP